MWASGGGQTKIAFGLPAGGDALKFRFGRGAPVYRKLVSTPGLRATFVVDRGSSQILGVPWAMTRRVGMPAEIADIA